MPVTLVPLTCPSCGGQLQIPEGTKQCYCNFCGTQIVVDDGSINLNIHDEADLRRVRNEERRQERRDAAAERRQQKYEEAQRRWKIALIVWLAVSLVMLALQAPVTSALPAFAQTYLVINGGVLLFGAIAIVVLRPKRPR